MGHLGTLLWKNFRWCKRHPLWTLLFYAVPIGFCGFLPLIAVMVAVDNTGDCDYQSMALPPSHPATIVSSLVCNSDTTCANRTAGYYPPHELFHWMNSSTDQGGTQPTFLCPGQDYSTTTQRIQLAMAYTCLNRSSKATYGNLPTIDLVFRGHILYYPSNDQTNMIMQTLLPKYLDGIDSLKVASLFSNFSISSQIAAELAELGMASACYVLLQDRTLGFNSRQDALDHAQAYNLSIDAVWAIVEFTNISSDFSYTLIPHYQTRSNLATLYLQALVETGIIEFLTNQRPFLNVESKQLPQRCQKNTAIYSPVYSVMQLVLSLGMVAFAYSLSSEICFEKGAGLLEFLFIAGVSRTSVKLSWLIYGLTFSLSLGAILGVILKFIPAHVIEYTPLLLVIVVMLLYMGSLVALCFVISSMLATAQRAGIFTFVILLVAYLAPTWGQLLPDVGYTSNILFARIFSILHCSVTVQIAFAYIIAWEKLEIGAQWNALAKSPIDGDLFHGIFECMIHHVIQIIYYMLLSWYLDYVAPSKYGFKLPWYFPLSPSFWGCCGQQQSDAVTEELDKASKADIEPRTDNKSPGIMLRNLTKSYGAKKVAVNDLSVNFYQNEITAILGHNGAGKSTTMNMLTGMIGPSSGTAIIDGKDMRNNMKDIRKSLGFCPQYDIIYPELSVEEHMKFYGNLKGIRDSDVKIYSEQLFTQMKMTHALGTAAGALSGGMKRKLSITISFLGDPTTIILDEPTSAIDPFSRRAIWDVVLRYREKSTIVISTHYMQEADILGDRIAIINHGMLKCYGTTMYLKAKYGTGFFLNLAHRKTIDAHAIEVQLRVHIPCTLKKTTASETSFAVPLAAARSEHMIEACRYLEQTAPDLGIISFGISESTMEQVFFKVAADDADDNQANMFNGANNTANAPDFTDYVNQQGLTLFFTQIWATWVKRAHLTKRSILGFVFQVLVPVGFTAILIFFNNVIASVGLNGQLVNVNPWNTSFKHGELFYSGSSQDPFINSWLQDDLGTICMTQSSIGGTCSGETPVLPNFTADNVNSSSCDCNKCPLDAAAPNASRVLLKGNDTLLNLSGRNISAYLIKSAEVHLIGGMENTNLSSSINCFDILRPFLALPVFLSINICNRVSTFGISEPMELYNGTDEVVLLMTGLLKQLLSVPSVTHTVWAGVVSANAMHPTKWESDNQYMRAALINGHNNILLRSLLTNGSNPLLFGISMATEEVSMTKALSVAQKVAGILLGFFSAFSLMMPSFSTILVVVNENDVGNKQLQFLMGLSRIAYWLANFIWDIFLYAISVLIVVGFMAIFKDTFNLDLMFFFECAMVFGVGLILLTYVLSFIIKTARFAILLVGMVSPVFTMAAMILLAWKTESWYSSVDTLLTLVPPYFITICLVTASFQQDMPIPVPLFNWDVLGKKFVLSAIWSVVMLLLLIAFESGFFRALGRMGPSIRLSTVIDGVDERDQDVINEEEAVRSSKDDNQVLAVKGLVKQYGRKGHVAVKGVTFGVNRNQCFGLLGVNGAGKSTLFKMLIGFEKPTSGDASILKCSIFEDAAAVAKHMSYCPQQDTLFESMTPEEHLFLYSRIRGIPASHREDIVNKMIAEVGLGAHVGKQSQALSGGNKRKLNFSISLLDYPDVIFLDEMTTGMDPKARRSAWTVLQAAINRGCVAVITSHSMEECESLCNRLVIMVNGQFRCIGGVQYLKDKFGRNYNIKLRLKPTADTAAIQSQIERSFVGSLKVEEHLGYLEMQCPADNLKLSFLLQFIHEVKDTLGIEDFSVSQTTLEHVFVNMVRDQE